MSQVYVGNGSGGSGPSTDLHTARFIVGDTSNGANYSTIAAALAAASSGDTVFLQTGIYTEDLTLKAGVNLCGFTGDDSMYKKATHFNCQIIGKLSASFSGVATVNNICLTTNGDNCVNVSGAATKLILNNCFIDVKDNVYGIVATTVANDFVMNFCYGATNSANAAFFHTSVDVIMNYCAFYIDASPSAASLISGGNFQVQYSSITSNITVSSGTLDAQDCFFANVTTSGGGVSMTNCQMGILTLGTSGSGLATLCEFSGGSSAAINIGAGTTLSLYGSTIISSATNVITGAGTLNYGALTFPGSSHGVNVTTMNGGFLPLNNGTTGQVWTSNGANVPATFQTAPASASMGPYIVGTELANYSTIQAAINAANATGHYSTFFPVDIVIKPKADGTYYVENITLFDGINLIAIDSGGNTLQANQDFQNSVVIHGNFTAPSTDQSLNKISGIHILTAVGDSFIDYPGVATVNEIDFIGCQIHRFGAVTSSFSSSGGGSYGNYAIFDNCSVDLNNPLCTDAGLNGSSLFVIFANGTRALLGNTTVSSSNITIEGANSDLTMGSYAGSGTAIINLMWIGQSGSGNATGGINVTGAFDGANFDIGSNFIAQNCPVIGLFDFSGTDPMTNTVVLTNCNLGSDAIVQATFTGNCTPTLMGCVGGCDYHNVSPVQTANYTTIVTDDVVPCDTSGGTITITLYATPFNGMTQVIKDIAGSAGAFNITIAGTIDTNAGGAVISTNFGVMRLTYNSALTTWMIT